MKPLLNPKQVAEILGTSESEVYQLAKTRKLRSVKFGDGDKSSVRFRQQDVEQYIASCIQDPSHCRNKSETIMEFVKCCRDSLQPDECVVYWLRLLRLNYDEIVDIVKLLPTNRLTIHRKVQKAKTKLQLLQNHCKDKNNR